MSKNLPADSSPNPQPPQHVPSPRLLSGHRAHVAVVGAGAFGSALAACAQAGGCEVTLLDKPQLATFSGDLSEFDLLILAVPTQALRSVGQWMHEKIAKPPGSQGKEFWVVSAAKGIEQKTLLLPHQILAEYLPSQAHIGTLSGPSFARELAAGLPTAVVLASHSKQLRERAELLLHRDFFRVYGASDIVGVEIGGALKNVIAMVAGAVDGLKLGNNARAAVVTRGLGEIAQVGVALGADPLTFLGLSGLGDLILTCTGDLSRNRQFGLRAAAGESPAQIIASAGQVIEGVTTAQSAYELSQKWGLDTPILKAAYTVLYENLSIKEAVFALLSRERKGEFDWIRK